MKSADKAHRPVACLFLFVLVCGACTLLFGAIIASVASAELDSAVLDLGAEAFALPGSKTGSSSSVLVNGVALYFEVESRNIRLADAWSRLLESCASPGERKGALGPLLGRFATRGAMSDDQAYVACVDLARDDLRSLARSVSRVVQSGDLSHLGQLRFAYAHTDPADPRRTIVLSSYAVGPFDLMSFLPRDEGDMPGSDLPNVRRPPNSRRLLSVQHESEALAVYRVKQNEPSRLSSLYLDQFAAFDWSAARPVDVRRNEAATVIAAELGSKSVTVIVVPSDGGSCLVIAFESELHS